MKKLILSMCVIVFACISFFSCSHVSYSSTVSEDGKIDHQITIVLDKNTLGNAFEDAKILSTITLTNFAEKFNNNIKEYNLLSSETNIIADAKFTPTDTSINYTLSLIISAKDALNYRQAMAAANSELADLMTNVATATDEYNTSLKAHEDKELDVETTFFFKKYILSKTDNIFANSKLLITSLASQFQQNDKLSGFSLNDITFSQTYLFSERDIKSTADKISFNAETFTYSHTYLFSYDEIDTKQIEIYKEIPNSVGWYIMALNIAVLTMAIYFIASKYKSTKNNSIKK